MSSFFAWKGQNDSSDLPTGESRSMSASPKQENGKQPPFSASGPPPTTLGYQPQSTSIGPPPTTYAYGNQSAVKKSNSPAAASPPRDETLDNSSSPGVHIFVPKAPGAEEEEDDSWVETSPTSAVENSGEKGEISETEEIIIADEDDYDNPYEDNNAPTPQQPEEEEDYVHDENNETPPPVVDDDDDDLPSPMQQNSSESNLDNAKGGDAWEEVDKVKGDENTGPQTLETVPAREELARGESPAEDFEWVNSNPSEEPSVISDSNYKLALRTNTTKQNESPSAADHQEDSSALVIPRGLPPFTRNVQKGLSKLQEKTARRQHEVRTRIHAVQCHMAKWSAMLATERMERLDSLQHFMDECVYQPAGLLVDRLEEKKQKARDVTWKYIEKDDDDEVAEDKEVDDEADTSFSQPRWQAAEARLNALECQMVQSAHALSKARREKILSLHDRLIYDTLPKIWEQRAEAAAQESLLLDRVDQLAGQCTAQTLKERAEREATMQLTREYLQQSKESYQERQENLLQVLADIRADLEREKEERQKQDEIIQMKINQIMDDLRDAILEAVGDPQD